jgi:lysophospholipase L1-like esterase
MHTYLALGDSYTIGEGVPLQQGYQEFQAPEIVARTGWTTDELAHTMQTLRLLPHYDFVTLLIGVNNQYRGRDTREYAEQFGQLLQKALLLTGSPSRVLVLSIPDWGYSPFAASRDRGLITGEIDAFNSVAREIAQAQHTRFLDITSHSRGAGATPESFVADGLHPAATSYRFWAEQLAAAINATLPSRQFPVD